MPIMMKTVGLLVISNCFMLTAWYFHLKQWNDKPVLVAAFLSWCIAGLEYSAHIPANRIGHTVFSLSQLQILQVGLSLLLFIPFTIFVMKAPVKMDFVWAALCLLAASYFIFRGTN